MSLEEYYLEISLLIGTVLGGLAIKDICMSFISGLKFKLTPQFKEGDKIILDGYPAIIIKVGLVQSVFGCYTDQGLTWRYISNSKIESLKLEKVIDSDAHMDSAFEKAQKIQNYQ